MADPVGTQGVRSNHLLGPNYFILMKIFWNIYVKLTKQNPFVNLKPHSRNTGLGPE